MPKKHTTGYRIEEGVCNERSLSQKLDDLARNRENGKEEGLSPTTRKHTAKNTFLKTRKGDKRKRIGRKGSLVSFDSPKSSPNASPSSSPKGKSSGGMSIRRKSIRRKSIRSKGKTNRRKGNSRRKTNKRKMRRSKRSLVM